MNVNEGELFILADLDENTYLLQYRKGGSFSSHRGMVPFGEEMRWGDKLLSARGDPYFVLRPSTDDRMRKVQRKTSILYSKDIGYMMMHTDIGAGAFVAEVGSGSGSLTTALATVVGESGRVYSYERRPEHQEVAKKNIEKYGLTSRVEWILRDVETEGFGDYPFTTLFVDVPEPWSLVPHARQALQNGGFWVSLSPNFEQVKQTVMTLQGDGFFVEKTVELLEREILVREFGVRPSERMISHTGFLTLARRVERG